MSTITIKEVGFKDGGYNNQDLNIRELFILRKK